MNCQRGVLVAGLLTALTVGGMGVFAQTAASSTYRVGPDDRLRIEVWNQANISGEYAVDGEGYFTFPHIGRVRALGLTLNELEGDVRRLLADGFYRNPQVTISVVEYRSQQVFVTGEMRQPGTYAITGETSVLEALARAGSTTPEAADHAFIVRSTGSGGPVLPGEDAAAKVVRVDLKELGGGQSAQGILVHDGDTVFVPRAAMAYVVGQVRNPGPYRIGANTTVLQALSLAGGPSEYGAVNRVRIVRLVDGEEQRIDVELNDVVQPDDTVVVPERYF